MSHQTPLSTSTSLLQRACADDQLAWERLCRLFGPTVYRAARKFGLGVEDAADIVQDVFSSVAKSLEGFDRTDPQYTFRGWLYVITRNKVRDRARIKARRIEAVPASDISFNLNLAAEETKHSAIDDVTETQRVVHRALDLIQLEFERRTWQAFRRVALDGAKASDVADELSMSIGAVYKAKSRVIHRLRTELDGLV